MKIITMSKNAVIKEIDKQTRPSFDELQKQIFNLSHRLFKLENGEKIDEKEKTQDKKI